MIVYSSKRPDDPCEEHGLGWHDWSSWYRKGYALIGVKLESRLPEGWERIRYCELCGSYQTEGR